MVSELLLFGISSNNDALNTCILNATIQYILATERFDVPLTYSWFIWIVIWVIIFNKHNFLRVSSHNSHFAILMLTLPFPTTVHTRFNDNWLFVSFFYYWYYYFSLVFFYLVLFFIKWLYNDLLNFSFCKYISSQPTSICSKLVLLLGAILFSLSISLNKFLLVDISDTKHWMYLVIYLLLLLKRVYVLNKKMLHLHLQMEM